MTRIKSVLVSSDYNEITCEYYEIEGIFRSLIENNPELHDDFKTFSQDYTYFAPYIDYAMFRLGYKIKNPLNLENAILEAKDGAIYLTQFSQSLEMFPKADDKTIRLFKLSPENIEISMADEELNAINPLYYDHERISRLLLNYMFIKDSELYIKFVEQLIDEETSALFFSYVDFLVNNASFLRVEKLVVTEKLKRFQAFKDKTVSYEIVGNKNIISETQKKFIEECLTKGIFSNNDIHLDVEEERKIRA